MQVTGWKSKPPISKVKQILIAKGDYSQQDANRLAVEITKGSCVLEDNLLIMEDFLDMGIKIR